MPTCLRFGLGCSGKGGLNDELSPRQDLEVEISQTSGRIQKVEPKF